MATQDNKAEIQVGDWILAKGTYLLDGNLAEFSIKLRLGHRPREWGEALSELYFDLASHYPNGGNYGYPQLRNFTLMHSHGEVVNSRMAGFFMPLDMFPIWVRPTGVPVYEGQIDMIVFRKI